MHGMPGGIHGRAASAPLSKLWQSVLRSLQQQQRPTASLRAHEACESVQQVFSVPSDTFYGLSGYIHQLNVSGMARKSDYFLLSPPARAVSPFQCATRYSSKSDNYQQRSIKSLSLQQ